MGWLGMTKGYRYKLEEVQLRHLLFTAKKVGLLTEVEAFLKDIENSVVKGLRLTESQAKSKGIDLEIAQTIIKGTGEKAKWLQRSFDNLIG
jgi:hypothetical protein